MWMSRTLFVSLWFEKSLIGCRNAKRKVSIVNVLRTLSCPSVYKTRLVRKSLIKWSELVFLMLCIDTAATSSTTNKKSWIESNVLFMLFSRWFDTIIWALPKDRWRTGIEHKWSNNSFLVHFIIHSDFGVFVVCVAHCSLGVVAVLEARF